MLRQSVAFEQRACASRTVAKYYESGYLSISLCLGFSRLCVLETKRSSRKRTLVCSNCTRALKDEFVLQIRSIYTIHFYKTRIPFLSDKQVVLSYQVPQQVMGPVFVTGTEKFAGKERERCERVSRGRDTVEAWSRRPLWCARETRSQSNRWS